MTSITISEINVTGLTLFEDGESYLDEVSDAELASVNGGFSPLLIAFATASTPECAAFAGGLIAGVTAGIAITKAFK